MSQSIYAKGGDADQPFYRGYLGQEHLLDYGLINLNARVYDPFIGRFLSPDPVYDASRSIFGFNPYVYGNNCPSVYIDPDGDIVWLIPVAGGVIGSAYNLIKNRGKIHDFWSFTGYAVAGFAGGFVGTLAATSTVGVWAGMGIGSLAGGFTSGTLGGFFNSIDKGWNFNNFWGGFCDSYDSGSIGGSIGGGIQGGYNAFKLSKASEVSVNIWNGKGQEEANRVLLQKKLNINEGEIHHVIPHQNSTWTPKYREITDKYNFDLNNTSNKLFISGHKGRHPIEYHHWVYDNLKEIDYIAAGDEGVFRQMYFERIYNGLKNNPGMVHKWWWNK